MRYGALKLGRRKSLDNDTVFDLYEHVFRTNVGDNIGNFMKALTEFKDELNLKQESNLREAPEGTEGQATDSESE